VGFCDSHDVGQPGLRLVYGEDSDTYFEFNRSQRSREIDRESSMMLEREQSAEMGFGCSFSI
jgi:hypothetical protein